MSKESAYLMLTSWDLASKQTWSLPLCLKSVLGPAGERKRKPKRKEGRCVEAKDRRKKGMSSHRCAVVRRVDLVHCARKLNKPIRNKTSCIPSYLYFLPLKKKKKKVFTLSLQPCNHVLLQLWSMLLELSHSLRSNLNKTTMPPRPAEISQLDDE